jgi:hypothetical protein
MKWRELSRTRRINALATGRLERLRSFPNDELL